jgi:hypothetical protein
VLVIMQRLYFHRGSALRVGFCSLCVYCVLRLFNQLSALPIHSLTKDAINVVESVNIVRTKQSCQKNN